MVIFDLGDVIVEWPPQRTVFYNVHFRGRHFRGRLFRDRHFRMAFMRISFIKKMAIVGTNSFNDVELYLRCGTSRI